MTVSDLNDILSSLQHYMVKYKVHVVKIDVKVTMCNRFSCYVITSLLCGKLHVEMIFYGEPCHFSFLRNFCQLYMCMIQHHFNRRKLYNVFYNNLGFDDGGFNLL